MVETLQIAIAGAAIGILVSLPVALLAARGVLAGRLVNTAVRVILGFIRAVPDLVWALVFVVAVGLGPLAGVLAIALDTLGFCGRFFADDMENTDPGPAEALTATGARRIDVAAAAVIPGAMPAFVSTSLFGLEKAVRSSTILGLVGAGGIGIELKVAFDLFDYPTALSVILMIAVVVVGVEQLGALMRQRIMGVPG
jgi:phosphonate transport system permease protein